MGCGCGGSGRKTAQPAERDGKTNEPLRKRRDGGMLDQRSGYYWSGPSKRLPKSADKPAE